MVIMLQGKDKGKKGKIIATIPLAGKVKVQGLNMVKRHQRPRKQGQKGQIISKERAVDASSVQILCPSCGKQTRVGHSINGDKKIRICKKCSADLT